MVRRAKSTPDGDGISRHGVEQIIDTLERREPVRLESTVRRLGGRAVHKGVALETARGCIITTPRAAEIIESFVLSTTQSYSIQCMKQFKGGDS